MFKKQIIKSYVWYVSLPISKRIILGSFSIWFLQAIPKWGFVLLGDGEMAAMMMTAFITPRADL